ncbi:STY4851/ECs_5259 family protein [Roseovarius nubinhibens]|uniref:STY4851/ECs_5259 family protein n=1 Tax=Roseovarius nubinhibens TaxID=314263 RepID=UPI0030EF6CA7|tara:strand:+ start:11375 stop:14605 length:3231 start_codon:yes stop_codon:yes gene_type:complete
MTVLGNLEDAGLIKPDGRPLHAYRINEADFSRFEGSVRQSLKNGRFRTAAAPFVLWAAERYRKEYDGGALSWDFLTQPLDVALSQQQLREITGEGLARMGRSVRRLENGTQYLRAIAAEGGIPVRLLSDQKGGYRSALVGLVADLSRIGLGCPRDVAMGFAAWRTRRLPVGYRTREYYELFVDFAFEVLELRELSPEGMSAQDVEPFLDRSKPGWRDSLSLRLDGEAARSLLSDAVLVSARQGVVTDPLTRVLRRGGADTDAWTPWIEVEETAEIASQLVRGVEPERRRLRLAPVGHLASAVPDLLFALDREAPDRPWESRRISGRRTARFRFPMDVGAELIAMADGAFLSRVRLSGGEGIEIGAGPTFWRLAEMGEARAEALAYAGNASLRTRDPHVWLLIEEGKTPECTDTLVAEPDGSVPGGTIWRLSGRGRVLVPGGNARIDTGAEDDGREEIHATGPLEYRLLDARGTPVHRGVPAILHRHPGRGFRQLVGGDLRHQLGGSQLWHAGSPSDAAMGRFAFAVREGHGVGARVTVNMVPPKFSVHEVTRGDDPSRRIRFGGVPNGWLFRVAEGKPQQPDADGVLEVQLDASAEDQARLPLTLSAPGGAAPFTWMLDLPRPRGEFQTVQGETLAANRDISMQTLKDWRIVPAEGRPTDLRVRLHSPSAGGAPVVGKRITVDQPLSAFRSLLEEMLVNGGADAELRLRVVTGGDQSPRLLVRHSLGETQLVGEDVLVLQDQTPVHMPDLEITAIDLDDPSRVVRTGGRGLSHLGNGRWFLLPRKGGVPMRPPRPFIRPEPVETTGQDARRRADRVAHYARCFHRSDVTEALSRLATLSETLLANGVSPSALDEVHALAQVPSAAVRLLFRVAPSDLEDALSLDLHGGPRWSFISPKDWAQAFADEAKALHAALAALPALADRAQEQARETVTARAADILRLRPALEGHVALALLRFDPMAVAELAKRLGGVSPGLQRPEETLLEIARAIVSRQAGNPPSLHELKARQRPSGFDAFHPDLRGLIEAPLVAAEIAFGLRPPPTTRQSIELLLAVQADQAGYEAAQPAAIAWLAQQKT